MPKISEDEQNKIKSIFQEQMSGEVNILFFGSDTNCDYCDDTREILEEVSSLDDRINLKSYNLDDDKAKELSIDRAPATIFLDNNGNDIGVHFYGIPSGYEFNTIIEDIIDASNEKSDLPEDIIKTIKGIKSKVLLQVFITPTCPYCPRSVRIAHQFAMINPNIRGEMIEAIEFQELSNKYDVSGVPKTVINNGAAEQVGAVPAQIIVDKIMQII
jgi:glutaredoxin-like protein